MESFNSRKIKEFQVKQVSQSVWQKLRFLYPVLVKLWEIGSFTWGR